ncbi:transglycosylase SLT domain-containing protein [Sphingosinicella sp. LY1275]|uniref:transglycosylase SLT domain-containing protein n=1 Tax=Sphingosinicella sp. LY1275 TaxID=3095379 RepID=UPI002ADEC2A8|nr:transglycosylase SLT domain-containing protein [Sphingosinicella sp. LY1275]MEA1015937.1 transglycosylase SLT domain-containing protein [Sphingosinicella sp. LY1275]
MFPTTNFTAGLEGAQGRVGAAIQRASARTGVDFSYLFNQAKVESGLNPMARARTSSATGLFQFIDQTWLGTVKKHGEAHGLGWAVDAISRGSDGRYRVADPATRRAILDLRNQPEAASAMAAEFASDNQAHLEGSLGRPVESVDLYLAHFLGAGGASKFLRAHDANPDAAAAASLPEAARANRWVFFNKDGSARSFAEIRERFAAKIGGSAAPLPMRGVGEMEFTPLRLASLNTGATAPVQKLPSPQYARLAYLMLAELGA